ncbi:MAG: NfeD family protein, partial [Bacillota bacterium]|nr:NfeD family protein [Bacillota bacterium]
LPWIVILALLGLLLLFVEILMPGFGLFGILGTVALLGSLVMAYKIYGFLIFLLFLAAAVLLFFAMILFAKKSGLYNKVVLKEKQEEKGFDESALQGLLGKVGVTHTELKPFGVAEVDGRLVDVCSTGDFIDRGTEVQVIQITGKTVTVKVY